MLDGEPAAARGRRTQHWFPVFARRLAAVTGHGAAFAIVCALVLAWAVSGPYFGFSDGWQFAISAFTSIITFLMVFVIQSAQKRDTEAIQIKLDELIRATAGAHNAVLDMEQASEEELAAHHKRYEQLAELARQKLGRDQAGDDSPALEEAEPSRRAGAR